MTETPATDMAIVAHEADILTFDGKTVRNIRAQKRYDELREVGEHGHYETMFRVIHEEVELALRIERQKNEHS